MSSGPPFAPDDSEGPEWPDWRAETTSLEYPDRDIRIIFPEQRRESVDELQKQPAEFGDFDPKPDDPDPDVWPLEGYDPGYPAHANDLILLRRSFPKPHVAWVTEEYLEARYGYNPVRQEVDVERLPKWHRPDDATSRTTVEVVATNDAPNRMTLTEDRVEALRRIARLWNGDTVHGQHLLLDKCPDWSDFLGDLDQDELRRLVVDPSIDVAFADAFSEYEWYEANQTVYTKPQWIARKKVWYSPTQRGRKLINKHSSLPNLRGDPKERLAHRFSVGLTVVREFQQDRSVETYYDFDEYNIDVISQASKYEIYATEVITGHNNNKHHRKTYRKLRDLDARGITPKVVFDGRDTAYALFNYWHNQGLATLPDGTFDSDFEIGKGREKTKEAYESATGDFAIADWTTTTALWETTLGPDGPEIDPDLIRSFSW